MAYEFQKTENLLDACAAELEEAMKRDDLAAVAARFGTLDGNASAIVALMMALFLNDTGKDKLIGALIRARIAGK